jgi:(2Fe-2S) ferredoxin
MSQLPRRTRIVLCRGQYCNLSRRADRLYSRLEQLVSEVNRNQYPKPVKLEIAPCLDMCGAGPNIVIYPDGIVCNGVEENMLDQIMTEHVRKSVDAT